MKKNRVNLFLITMASYIFISWGYQGHQMINRKSVESFPHEMNEFRVWEEYLMQHSTDADTRKGSDPNEGHKHYIDIDNYPEFVANGYISMDLNSLITEHGQDFVDEQGILPWAILATYDSLQTAFTERDFTSAKQFAADLGHYVADAHMPLHLTRNYNGQFTNQDGIHFRYESYMIGLYADRIEYAGDTIAYVEDVSEYAFGFIYKNYEFMSTLLEIDSLATEMAGSNSDMNYFSTLWYYTRDFTQQLFHDASSILATLIYTAWINAGKPMLKIPGESDVATVVSEFQLKQNYPNPFNAKTIIGFYMPEPGAVNISLHDLVGRQVALLANGYYHAGHHRFTFDAGSLSSGTYLYRLAIDGRTNVKKMCIVR